MRHFLKALSFVVSLLPATLCAAESLWADANPVPPWEWRYKHN